MVSFVLVERVVFSMQNIQWTAMISMQQTEVGRNICSDMRGTASLVQEKQFSCSG